MTKKVNKSMISKVLGGVGAVAVGVLVGVAGANTLIEPEVIEVAGPTEFVEVEVVKEVPVEVVKEVEIIKEIDNGKLSTVLDFVQENCDADYCDVDDDELDEITENIIFENDAQALAEAYVKEHGLEYLDDEDEFRRGVLEDYRESDVYRFNVDEDDTEVTDIDYEDKQATVKVVVDMSAKDNGEREHYDVTFELELDGDEVSIVDAIVEIDE